MDCLHCRRMALGSCCALRTLLAIGWMESMRKGEKGEECQSVWTNRRRTAEVREPVLVLSPESSDWYCRISLLVATMALACTGTDYEWCSSRRRPVGGEQCHWPSTCRWGSQKTRKQGSDEVKKVRSGTRNREQDGAGGLHFNTTRRQRTRHASSRGRQHAHAKNGPMTETKN